MVRIVEAELERLKRQVSLAALAEARSVVLTPQGVSPAPHTMVGGLPVSPSKTAVSEDLARRRSDHTAAIHIRRARPHRLNSHRVRRRFSRHTRTGLYYDRARYFHPARQRFISEDPIGFADGANLSTYVNNYPLGYVDPLGYAKGGRHNISVTQDGKVLTKQTPIQEVEKALEIATQRGLSPAHISKLRGLLKVIARGGTMEIVGITLGELLNPTEAGAGSDCPSGPGTCGHLVPDNSDFRISDSPQDLVRYVDILRHFAGRKTVGFAGIP